MNVEPAPDGWFIERDGRYYHVNESWLNEMFRHQVKPYGNNPAFNRLLVAFRNGADADEVAERFVDFYDNRTANRPAKSKGEDSEFQQFIKERRAANRR